MCYGKLFSIYGELCISFWTNLVFLNVHLICYTLIKILYDTAAMELINWKYTK